MEKNFEDILLNLGGVSNISTLDHCMTRLRVTVNDGGEVNEQEIKKNALTKGVVVNGKQIQIILGLGFSNKAFNFIRAKTNTTNQTHRKSHPNRAVLTYLSSIFTTLIPGLVGCGLIMGIVNTSRSFFPVFYQSNLAIFSLLELIGKSFFFFFPVIVGYTIALKSSASPVIGAIIAGVLSMPSLGEHSLFGYHLMTNSGGIFAVLIVVTFSSWLEIKLHKIITPNFDLILTPLLTILTSLSLAFLFFQPMGDYISKLIVAFVTFFFLGGVLISIVSGALLGGLFLLLLLTGLHQTLIPIHAQILSSFGLNYLFPILAMGGMGQVGACLWVLLKTKNKKLRNILVSSIPVGLLGVGEPLLFGVSLPLGRPFIAGCFGGAAGGASVAAMKIGAIIPAGTAGLSLIPMIGEGKALSYFTCALIACIIGFISSVVLGFDENKIK